MAAVLTGLLTGLMLLVAAGILRMDAPHVGLLWLLAWLCSASVAAGTIVLFAVLGASIGQLLAMLLFVYAGLATADGTVPLQALPSVLQPLAQVEPLRQILDGARAILYFDAQADAGLTRAVTAASLGLVFWLVLGAVVVGGMTARDSTAWIPNSWRMWAARCSSTSRGTPTPGNRTPGTRAGKPSRTPRSKLTTGRCLLPHCSSYQRYRRSNGLMLWQAGSRPWQQDRHQGRRTVWPPWRPTQNPAGLCRQWMHSWMVCGSSRGMVIVRRLKTVAAGAAVVWPAATRAPASRAAICG